MEKTQENFFLEELDLNNVFIQKSKLVDLYLFAVNHKIAPVAIREKFAIPEYTLNEANQNLKQYKSLMSFLLLSTCNRAEIYFRANDLGKALEDIYTFLNRYLGIEVKIAKEYSTIVEKDKVVQHAFNVASGLDSLVIGESQVLSQVKSAYSVGQKEQTLDNMLELLFQDVIKAAKEIHKNTNISKNCQSISSAAIDLANKVAGPLKTKQVMVLGAGKMAELALEHILKIGGSKETVVLNRSPHRVIEFSDRYKIDTSFPFENIYNVMNEVDIVIAATGAPHFILFADQFSQARKDGSKQLHIFDISMPRNIDPGFGKLPNITLMDIDSLQVIYSQTNHLQKVDLDSVEKIISKHIHRFYEKILNQNISVVIKELKDKVEKTTAEKLSLLLGKKTIFSSEEVKYITKNVINTILHTPIKNIKGSHAYGSQDEKTQVLRDLFEL